MNDRKIVGLSRRQMDFYKPTQNQFCCDGSSSTDWQKLGWINRLTLTTNLKVQLDPLGIGFPHLGYLLPSSHLLVFLDQQALIVGICGQKRVVVFENDQVSITAQTCTRIDNLAICGRQDRITSLPGNVQPFVFDFVPCCIFGIY